MKKKKRCVPGAHRVCNRQNVCVYMTEKEKVCVKNEQNSKNERGRAIEQEKETDSLKYYRKWEIEIERDESLCKYEYTHSTVLTSHVWHRVRLTLYKSILYSTILIKHLSIEYIISYGVCYVSKNPCSFPHCVMNSTKGPFFSLTRSTIIQPSSKRCVNHVHTFVRSLAYAQPYSESLDIYKINTVVHTH